MKVLGLLFLGFFLLTACGSQGNAGKPPSKKGLKIVTSFYPMYIDAVNITKGIDGVEVINMTKPQTGCLHDYQLTTEDMKTLSSADIFIVNGAGMEGFLDKAAEQQKNLKIIDASKSDDIEFLKDDGEDNPHVWVSITYNIDQVKAITSQLAEADPKHADAYRKNALEYITKLSALRDEMHANLDNLPHKDIVTFHEAFPYFAKEFHLNIIRVIEREPGTEPTPKVKKLPVKVLFTEPQYSPLAAKTIAEATGAKIYELDPVVTGEATPDAADAYLTAMRKNMEVLKEALQ